MAIALYARKSVERENSISCETQIEYCKAMIRPDESHQNVIEYIDNGFSGGNTNREAFQKMMRGVERGAVTKIIVYRLDRISRSLADFVGILETLKKYNVGFFSSQESFDTSSPYGEMIVKILMVFAEFERRSIIERVTQAYAHRSEKGFYMGGRRPYGFDLQATEICGIKTKMLVPKEPEAEHIKYIFESYSAGNATLRKLMDDLLADNILPESGGWSTAKLSGILKNPIYVKADNAIYEYYARHNTNIISDIAEFDGVHGVRLYGKAKHTAEDFSDMKLVVMTHEGLVSSEVWLRCQKKLEKNKQIGNSLSNATSWLGGRIACKSCGRTMTVTKGGRRADGSHTRYFSCTGKSHKRVCKGVRVPVYADSLEDAVYEMITEKFSYMKSGRKKMSSDNSGKINLLKNRLSEIGKEQDKLIGLVLRDDVATDMIKLLNDRAIRLSAEKQEIAEKIEALEAEASEVISAVNLPKKWQSAGYEERKAVANLLIDKIFISEDGSTEIVWNI